MLNIENTKVEGWEAAFRGMRNPYDSWSKSDSTFDIMEEYDCQEGRGRFLIPANIGEKDLNLGIALVKNGDCHAKFARMIVVTADINGPRYWWPEFDQYKVGNVTDSCSTMHTIMKRTLDEDDFSADNLNTWGHVSLKRSIESINAAINMYNSIDDEYEKASIFYEVIKILPQSYNQKRTVMTNYQALRNMFMQRKGHKLVEWREFRNWIKSLPHSDLITGGIE